MTIHPLVKAGSLALALAIALPITSPVQAQTSSGLLERPDDAQVALDNSQSQPVAMPTALDTSDEEVTWSRDNVMTSLSADGSLRPSTSVDDRVDVGLSVTEHAAPKDLSVTTDGTTIMHRSGTEAAHAMQILDNGAINASVLLAGPDAAKTTQYDFTEDVAPVLQKTGAVALYKDDVLVGVVEQPVSHDASGAEVDSHYSIEGNRLVQTVDPEPKSVYPIVAQAAVAVFYTRGDYVHVTRGQASGHGWWIKGTAKATKAKVTVQLQYKPKKTSSWNRRGKAGVKTIGPGTSKRANARMTCRSQARKQWRSWVDVNLIGYLDSPNKLYTSARTLKCTL